jgi:hypothetical protein
MHSPSATPSWPPARRQVEHVARLEHPVLLGLEVGAGSSAAGRRPARVGTGRCASAAARAPAAGRRRRRRGAGRRRRRRWPRRSSGRPGGPRARSGSAAAARARRQVQVQPLHQQVQLRLRHRRQRAPRQRPVAHRQRRRCAPPGAIRRRRCRPARTAGARDGGSTPGQAWRTSSGFFCQWRRMNCAGLSRPAAGWGVMSIRGFWPAPCAIILRMLIKPPASSASPGR